jgi:hypothetical protein
MNQSPNPYATDYGYESFAGARSFAADATVDQRADFLTKTYMHLMGAILAFVAITAFLVNHPATPGIIGSVFSLPFGQLLVLGGFIGVSWLAEWWAHSSTSKPMQYAGLGLYVVAEAIFFTPLLYIASKISAPWVIPAAGITTTVVFAGLTIVVFATRKNFSFLLPALSIAGFALFAFFLVAAFVPGFNMGEWRVLLVLFGIVLASGWVLYSTSQVMHEYRVGQHVAASLSLFASIALLFWYLLQLFMSLSKRD